MNERIKQLLNQAYDEAVPETWTELSSEQLGRVYDKFAELIVKECVYVSEGYFGFKDHTPGTAIAKEMKQHFGVE